MEDRGNPDDVLPEITLLVHDTGIPALEVVPVQISVPWYVPRLKTSTKATKVSFPKAILTLPKAVVTITGLPKALVQLLQMLYK